ncbi:MAG: DEAD/DEAH box helicase [candidate division SR1 bacterium]|nr:DEAD/DEAH box helicase [candidate division SR1 bacterium]
MYNQNRTYFTQGEQQMKVDLEALSKSLEKEIDHNAIKQFLAFIISTHNLTIGEYFPQIKYKQSFFMLAATGLGKTLAIPVYLLYLIAERYSFIQIPQTKQPTIWVVVPKITIAEGQAEYLNVVYRRYLDSLQVRDPTKPVLKSQQTENSKNVLFGYRTSKGTKNPDAPIQFITTGILPLIAESSELDPCGDSVIIDEAHVSLETDEAMEIAIVQLKNQGIWVSYMSATVDDTGLEKLLDTKVIKADQSRFRNFYHNTGKHMLECVEDVIIKTLIEYDTTSEYFPRPNYFGIESKNWHTAVLDGTNCKDAYGQVIRSSGLLIVINSFTGENSNAMQVEKQILGLCKRHGIEVLLFASKVNRNPKLKANFDKGFQDILKNNKKYVIITTNVVEMGITWETLDYVLTMDSESEDVDIDGYKTNMLVPLGTNALKQRIGRVGRKRAGIGIITKEFGTEYTDLNDEELNEGGLANQPISFPLSRVKPMKLGYMLTQKLGLQHELSQAGIESMARWTKKQLYDMKFPSLYKDEDLYNVAGMTIDIIDMYHKLGITDPAKSEAVKLAERWVGTPGYPFVLKSWEWIVKYRGTWEFHRRYYDVFLVYNYIAVLLNYPITTLLGINEETKKKTSAQEVTKIMQLAPWNSDLIGMGQRMSNIARVTPLELTGGYAGDIITLRQGLNPNQVKKFAAENLSHFEELIKVYTKHGGRDIDPMFFSGFEKGYLTYDDEEDGDYFETAGAFRVSTRLDSFANLYPLVFADILSIYKIIGVSTKLKKIDQNGDQYQYTINYDGQTITGVLNQDDHFCKLDETHTFWGIVIPRVIKDREDITIQDVNLRLSWLLRKDTDYYA